MNLKDLKYLVALADTGHFGRAAERTFVSQPTLSAQLKKLEDYLGVKLVERQPKNVQLTDVGKQIVVRARRMLSEGDEIVALARDNTNPLSGKLKIALIPTIGPYLLPRVMQKIRKALPRPRSSCSTSTRPRAAEAAARRGDRPRHRRAAGRCTRASSRARCTGRLSWWRCRTITRSRRSPSIKVQDLKDQTLLLLEDGHCLRDQALEVCSRVDVREPEDFRATSLETLRQMVVAGLGITLDAGARGGTAVRVAARPHRAPVRQAGADAHRGRGVAQDEHALAPPSRRSAT